MGSLFGGGGGGEEGFQRTSPQRTYRTGMSIAEILAAKRGEGGKPGMAEEVLGVAKNYTTDTPKSVVNAGDALANYFMQRQSAQPAATSTLGYSDQRFG